MLVAVVNKNKVAIVVAIKQSTHGGFKNVEGQIVGVSASHMSLSLDSSHIKCRCFRVIVM